MSNVLTGIINITAPGVDQTLGKVEASVIKTDKSLSKLRQTVSAFGGGVKSFTSSFQSSIVPIANTGNAVTNLANKMNASRGVQQQFNQLLRETPNFALSAQIGILSLSNNLPFFTDAITKARASGQGLGSILKTMGGSFLTLSGIATIATTVLVAVSQNLFGAGKTAKQTSEEVERLATFLKELGNIPDRKETIAAGTAEETSRVLALSNAVLDQTRSYNERNNALNQLKDINKNYFGDMTLESTKLATLKTKVEEYTNAIIASATVKAFSEDIGKLNVELAKQVQAFNKSGNALDELKRIRDATPQFRIVRSEREVTDAYLTAERAVQKATKAHKENSSVFTELSEKMKEFKEALQSAVDESLKFDPLKNVSPAKVREVEEAIKKIRTAIDFGELKLKPLTNEQISKMFPAGALPAFKEPIIIPVTFKYDKFDPKKAFQLEKMEESIDAMFAGLGKSMIVAIGEGIGSFAAGKNPFGPILDMFSGFLKQIGEALIAYGVVKTGLDKILAGGGFALPGGIAIALGILAIASSQLLKSVKLPGRAQGGDVWAGQGYTVGEAGAERFYPKVDGRIMANNAMNSGGGFLGSGVVGHVMVSMRGDDLFGLAELTRIKQRRWGA